MHLKRYQAQTVQEALRAAREELGAHALVLSTRLVAARGPRGWFGRRLVEVTAAADRTIVPDDRQESASAASRLRRDRPATTLGQAGDAGRATREIAARLTATGLDAGLARTVARAHPPDRRRGASARGLTATLAEQLAPLAATDDDDGYAPFEVFIGPPGVGKTTTIAKIAAQELARRGNRLALIAADGFRVGAVEQLRLYANVLDSPLTVARTPYELLTAMDAAATPVLVDTAGRSPADDASGDMLRLVASRSDARCHLVAAADTPPSALSRILDRFACVRPQRLVLTKVDEAASLAPVVALLKERGMRLSYLGTGQRVPDDLEIATPRALAAWVAGADAGQGAVA
jgi:flagellar biosynthesis protein FlhF